MDDIDTIRDDVAEIKDALEHAQDWLDDAAVGYSRGGFDATSCQRRAMQDRRDRLAKILEQHEERLAAEEARLDREYEEQPEESDDEFNDWLVSYLQPQRVR